MNDNKLTSQITYNGKTSTLKYTDTDSFDNLEMKKCRQVYGVCFCDDRMVIVLNGNKSNWGLPGGTLEEGESIEEALKREMMEETNMRVEKWRPLGVQEVIHGDGSSIYQLRVVCKVSPVGPFVYDPDGTVTEIKLIDPNDYKKYFDWGEIGEKIVNRAKEFKEAGF